MNFYILDTDIFSLFQQGNVAVTNHIARRASQPQAITVITVEEMLSGWQRTLR